MRIERWVKSGKALVDLSDIVMSCKKDVSADIRSPINRFLCWLFSVPLEGDRYYVQVMLKSQPGVSKIEFDTKTERDEVWDKLGV